jgi:beta-aspartyl-peptidase (threonine type)
MVIHHLVPPVTLSLQEERDMFAVSVLALVVLSTGEPAKERAAIQKVLDDQVVAWNKGDLEAFMAGYWKSEKLSFFSGNAKTAGWQATLDRYRKRYQAEGKEMGKLSFEELSIERLGEDYALVRGRFRLQLTKETPTGIFTLIVRKLPEGWRIVHDHTSS